jgi:hypothetical protein
MANQERRYAMNRTLIKSAVGIGTAVVLAVSAAASPAAAAPVLSNVAGLKALGHAPVTDVRWRGHHGNAGALAAGIIAGLALSGIASSPYVYGYGAPYVPYGYSPGFYGYYGGGGGFQDSFRNSY